MKREVSVERSPALRKIQLLLGAALLIIASVPSFSLAAEQRAMHDAFGENRPWPAPTSHRQPHAVDVPQELGGYDDQLYATLDRKLRICRGC